MAPIGSSTSSNGSAGVSVSRPWPPAALSTVLMFFTGTILSVFCCLLRRFQALFQNLLQEFVVIVSCLLRGEASVLQVSRYSLPIVLKYDVAVFSCCFPKPVFIRETPPELPCSIHRLRANAQSQNIQGSEMRIVYPSTDSHSILSPSFNGKTFSLMPYQS